TVQFRRSYQLENRVLILAATPRVTDAAILTLLREKPLAPRADERDQIPPASARLDMIHVAPLGRVTSYSGTLTVPLQGPTTAEHGFLIEAPRARLGQSTTWETIEDGRPARRWSVTGTESVSGSPCLKLIGVQQSDDWEQPRADRSAWRRQDTVWLAARTG